MARAWPRFLTGLATLAPTAILLEDLHWADERMVDMIESLATRSRAASCPRHGTAGFLGCSLAVCAGGDITLSPCDR